MPDLYPVLVHGVQISRVKTTDQRVAARHIESQNASLHPGLCVKRSSWPRGVHTSGEKYSSLTVYLTTPEMANRVIEKGLVEGGEVKEAERFLTGLGLVQSFKCCAYGHIVKHCRVAPRCGHCSQSHETRSCTQKDISICPNCKGTTRGSGHKAWAEACFVRTKVRKEHQDRYNTRPYKYPVEVKPDRRPLVFTTEPPKPKPGPGRPKGSRNRSKARTNSEGVAPASSSTLVDRQDEAMEVDSLVAPTTRPPKRARQATLSFISGEEK
jgi:hypothetical protein